MAQRNYLPKHRSRDTGHKKFNGRKKIDALYDKVWESYRKKFLDINPFCYSCSDNTVATVVDHLKPHKGDVNLFKKTDNHIPLCEKCHNTVTGLFDQRYKAGSPIDDKILWLNRNRYYEGKYPRRVKVLARYE